MITFTPGDRHSETWRKIRTHLEYLLDSRRKELELNKTPEETERLRGRIAELKGLLKIEEDQIIEDLPLPTR